MGPTIKDSGFQTGRRVLKAFQLALEDDEFSEELRQMAVGRYRVLFTIKGRKVHGHVRGPTFRSVYRLEEGR